MGPRTKHGTMHHYTMTTTLSTTQDNDARPLKSLQGGAASGSVTRRNPTSTTGGPSQSRDARGRGRKTTGKPRTPQPIRIMHWNSESISNKKTELEHILKEKGIGICCIQETHLQPDKTFKIRGYQCFRSDRMGRSKGGILTLVRNNIGAKLQHSHMKSSEHHTVNIQTRTAELDIVNFYCPDTRPLDLDSIKPKCQD